MFKKILKAYPAPKRLNWKTGKKQPGASEIRNPFSRPSNRSGSRGEIAHHEGRESTKEKNLRNFRGR
jgi:hypothetical protein